MSLEAQSVGFGDGGRGCTRLRDGEGRKMAEGSRQVKRQRSDRFINECRKCYRIMKRFNLLEFVGRWMVSVVQMPGPHDLEDARVRLAKRNSAGKMRHHRKKT
jgi:hypothetical protein